MRATRALFAGVDALLDAIERARLALGHRHQQGDALHGAAARARSASRARAGAVVCGDTTPHREAASGAAAARGAQRWASRRRAASTSATPSATSRPAIAAGMRTIVARYGYIEPRRDARTTGRPTACIDDPLRAARLAAAPTARRRRAAAAALSPDRRRRSEAATRAACRRACRRRAPAGSRVSGCSTAPSDVVGDRQRDAVGLLDAVARLHRRASPRSRCRRARPARRARRRPAPSSCRAARSMPVSSSALRRKTGPVKPGGRAHTPRLGAARARPAARLAAGRRDAAARAARCRALAAGVADA